MHNIKWLKIVYIQIKRLLNLKRAKVAKFWGIDKTMIHSWSHQILMYFCVVTFYKWISLCIMYTFICKVSIKNIINVFFQWLLFHLEIYLAWIILILKLFDFLTLLVFWLHKTSILSKCSVVTTAHMRPAKFDFFTF